MSFAENEDNNLHITFYPLFTDECPSFGLRSAMGRFL